jgi:SPP1 gp7 family putative phage head morphogenesis protein
MIAAAQVRANRTRQAVDRARARGHVPRPMSPQAPPAAAERAYTARLRMIVGGALTRAYAPLLRALPDLVAQARQERGDAADWRSDATNSGRSASAAVKEAAREAQASLGGSAVRAAAQEAAGDASAHVQAQLGKQVREVLGIDLAADARAKARAAAFVHENVKLISGIGPTLAAEVERLVLAGLTGGHLHEMLAKVIQRKLQVATDRAELIAIDQVGKIVGQINAARQQDLGVTHFYWRTSKDERVRGNPAGKYPNAVPSHYDREGKRYAYADPPKGKNGEPELPGTAIRCRCGAEADLSTVLGEEPAAPAPRDPAAPDAPNRAPSVEEAEAEAERLRREVEAMLARQLSAPPVPVPPGRPDPVRAAIAQAASEALGGDQVAAARAVAERYARAAATHQAAVEARRAEDREHLDAIRAMNRELMARDVHEAFAADNFIDRNPMLVDEFRQLVRDNGFKRITVEEMTHAFAPPSGMTAKIEELNPNGDGGPMISVAYYDADRNRVGRVTREFRPNGEINHTAFIVNESAQRAGLSATINGQALLRYQKWGVQEVTLDATWVGRYAWAKAGFEIDKSDHANVLRAADAFIDEKVPADRRAAYKARVRELIEEPWRLAAWSDGNDYDVFFDAGGAQQTGAYALGKALLLDHRMPTWSGRMRVADGDQGFRTALRSTRVKDRK